MHGFGPKWTKVEYLLVPKVYPHRCRNGRRHLARTMADFKPARAGPIKTGRSQGQVAPRARALAASPSAGRSQEYLAHSRSPCCRACARSQALAGALPSTSTGPAAYDRAGPIAPARACACVLRLSLAAETMPRPKAIPHGLPPAGARRWRMQHRMAGCQVHAPCKGCSAGRLTDPQRQRARLDPATRPPCAHRCASSRASAVWMGVVMRTPRRACTPSIRVTI